MQSQPATTGYRPNKRWLVPGITACLAMGLVLGHFWPTLGDQVDEKESSTATDSVEPIQPIEQPDGLDLKKVKLGGKLFHDPGLSHTGEVSCASCHDLNLGGTDRKVTSNGIGGARGLINAPTIFNSALNFSQFWDGRAPTLETQIDGPVQSKLEMGSTWPEVIAKLKTSREYIQDFQDAYGDGVQAVYVKESIAEFERSLTTPNSRFDRYLRHTSPGINNRELEGYNLFKRFGCASCHQGMNVGGNMYQKVGVMGAYFRDRGHTTKADFGRFNVTGDPADKYMFKVPSLRNVALTSPYFHDGSAATLSDAVRMMAKYQLGRRLNDQEIGLLVEFLKTLTGELNGKPL